MYILPQLVSKQRLSTEMKRFATWVTIRYLGQWSCFIPVHQGRHLLYRIALRCGCVLKTGVKYAPWGFRSRECRTGKTGMCKFKTDGFIFDCIFGMSKNPNYNQRDSSAWTHAATKWRDATSSQYMTDLKFKSKHVQGRAFLRTAVPYGTSIRNNLVTVWLLESTPTASDLAITQSKKRMNWCNMRKQCLVSAHCNEW